MQMRCCSKNHQRYEGARHKQHRWWWSLMDVRNSTRWQLAAIASLVSLFFRFWLAATDIPR
jgi:hypothetical protein